MQFDGQRVVITGGSSGIGKAVAHAFHDRGANVIIAGRDSARLQLAGKGRSNIICHETDVSDAKHVERLFRAAYEKLGDIDILVNNAGTNIKARAIRELTIENWHHLIRTNMDSAFYCIQAVLPRMLARRSGMIVNISSVAGLRAWPTSGAGYAAAKFGMSALGICLSAEERESGVRVTNIYPGEVDTPLMQMRPNPPTPEQCAKLLQPEDVAEAVLFVASLPPRAHVPELVIKPTTQYFI